MKQIISGKVSKNAALFLDWIWNNDPDNDQTEGQNASHEKKKGSRRPFLQSRFAEKKRPTFHSLTQIIPNRHNPS